jgi:hypothetical protein
MNIVLSYLWLNIILNKKTERNHMKTYDYMIIGEKHCHTEGNVMEIKNFSFGLSFVVETDHYTTVKYQNGLGDITCTVLYKLSSGQINKLRKYFIKKLYNKIMEL